VIDGPGQHPAQAAGEQASPTGLLALLEERAPSDRRGNGAHPLEAETLELLPHGRQRKDVLQRVVVLVIDPDALLLVVEVSPAKNRIERGEGPLARAKPSELTPQAVEGATQGLVEAKDQEPARCNAACHPLDGPGRIRRVVDDPP
jgi:hypothetical protein